MQNADATLLLLPASKVQIIQIKLVMGEGVAFVVSSVSLCLDCASFGCKVRAMS
jgi:hypothetical protein